jgi:hypothetical protein
MGANSDKLRVYLRGELLETSPIKDNEAIIDLKRDIRIEGLFEESGMKFLFTGDGYDKIVEILETEGACTRVEVLVQERICDNNKWQDLLAGTIPLTSIVQDYAEKSIEVDFEDDTFSSKIRSNIEQKAFLNVGRSRNDIPITPVASIAFDAFTPSTGAYPGSFSAHCYPVVEAFEFLIQFMTDGTVGFKSDYLEDSSNWVNQDFIAAGDTFDNGKLYLITAKSLRIGTATDKPNISFSELFRNIRRNTNISMGIDLDDDENPRVRIEKTEFFFQNANTIAIRDISDLRGKIDTRRLYSRLNVGNPDFVQEVFSTFDNDVQFLSFKEEDYGMRGDCTEDVGLDLRTQYLTDTNILEDILINSNDDFDGDTIIVVGDELSDVGGVAARLVRYTVSGIAPYHYNDTFKNNEIINRWQGSVPASIAKYIDDANFTFRASVISPPFLSNTRSFPIGSTAPQTITRTPFDNETTPPNFDVGSNYNNLAPNWFYTVPLGGDFTFETEIDIFGEETTPTFAGFANFSILVRLFRGTTIFTPIEIIPAQLKTLNIVNGQGGSNIKIFLDHKFEDMTAAERVWVEVKIDPGSVTMPTDVTVDVGSYFACTLSEADGGVYKVFDPDDFRARSYTFTRNLPLEDYKTIRDNVGKTIIINEGLDQTNDKICWIERITYNFNTSEATFDLKSK